jgi:geranylgeranyl pyrophosphate synthase
MKQHLAAAQARINQQLEHHLLQLACTDERLAAAMQYGLMNGGKRLRPFLAYATAHALGGAESQVDAAAVALEMIHSYSLVHDDLPAMDDDNLRRGKPTTHIAFDEATAILAGDGLLTAAFEVLVCAPGWQPAQTLELVRLLAQASGAAGMVAGQCIDLNHVGKAMTLEQLERMHRHKTGALIRCAVLMGATAVSWPLATDIRDALLSYAEAIGLAFQVQDDILDIEGATEILGKTQGADLALNKPTYPALLGMEGARQKAADLCAEAHAALENVPGDTRLLGWLADYIVVRDH